MAQFFRPRARLLNSPSHTIIHGTFHDSGGQALDEVLCFVFRAPHSYTGEDSVEISCHGNPRLASRILENLLTQARLARPGEFTLRALLNGKLDLTQAEAVNDLIAATGSKAETAALLQVRGVLSRHLQEILTRISDARLRCELAIDFADQDLPPLDPIDLQNRISRILKQARNLRAEGEQGRLIREGARICLAGPPNAGKSSLFNAFLRCNRAIVTPHPGTTRDYLEETVSLSGYALIFCDTAGLRASPNDIERQGIERSLELMRSADLVLYLTEATTITPEGREPDLPSEIRAKTLWLASKVDLLPQPKPASDAADGSSLQRAIPVSVFSPGGIDALSEAILARLQLPEPRPDRPLVTNARHLAALARCEASLQRALQSLKEQSGYEFTAFELRAASQALEEILGLVTPEDLLQEIFSSFCVGK